PGATQAVGSIVGRFPACSISIVSLSSRLAASAGSSPFSRARGGQLLAPWSISGDPSLRTGRVQCSPASFSGQRAQVSPQTVGAGTRNKALDLTMRASPDG